MRTDREGRDVSGLPGIWSEDDTCIVSLRVYKPPHPPDSWYQLLVDVGGTEYRIGPESIAQGDCRDHGEILVRAFARCGIAVEHAGIYLPEIPGGEEE